MSPDERAKNKKSLLKNFKSNILSLENSLDKLDNLKHSEIVKNSFGVGDSPQKLTNGNQLWILLEKLNNKKVQLKASLEEEKLFYKKKNYISGLDN